MREVYLVFELVYNRDRLQRLNRIIIAFKNKDKNSASNGNTTESSVSYNRLWMNKFDVYVISQMKQYLPHCRE